MAQDTGKSTLIPQLTLSSLFFIIVANTVGSGIFTTSGFIMQDVLSPPALLLCWFIGGLLALAGGLCYGELGAMFPAAGGDYVFLRESFGKRIAFLSGWTSLWVGFSAPIAAVAIAFGSYVTGTLPAPLSHPGTPTLLAVGIIAFFTWAHLQGILFGIRMHNVLTLLKIVLILFLVGAGLAWGNGSLEHFKAPFTYTHLFSQKFATSLIFVSFAYSGWNACVYLGSEIKNAPRNIPLSIVTATLAVIVIYLLVNVVYIYALPPQDMFGVKEIGSAAAARLFGETAGSLFAIVIAFCLLSAVSSMIMIGPRVYYAMAQDRLFLRLLGNVSRTRHVPTYAIILQGVVAILLVLTATFYALLIYVGFLLAIFSSLTVAGMVLLRSKRPDGPRPYRTWGYPLTPAFFLIGNAWIVVCSIRNNLTAFIWGVITVAAGLLIYEYCDGRLRKVLSFRRDTR